MPAPFVVALAVSLSVVMIPSFCQLAPSLVWRMIFLRHPVRCFPCRPHAPSVVLHSCPAAPCYFLTWSWIFPLRHRLKCAPEARVAICVLESCFDELGWAAAVPDLMLLAVIVLGSMAFRCAVCRHGFSASFCWLVVLAGLA